jgi:hypothetical protein
MPVSKFTGRFRALIARSRAARSSCSVERGVVVSFFMQAQYASGDATRVKRSGTATRERSEWSGLAVDAFARWRRLHEAQERRLQLPP